MNNEDNSLDLLDLDDNDTMDTLPEVPAFTAPRPKKPWLLLTVGVMIIVLASYIIIRSVSDETSSSIEVDLDAPVMVVDGEGVPVDMNVMPQQKPVVQPKPAPVEVKLAPVAQPQPEPVSAPVRVIEDRKEVKFEPAKVAKPAPKPAAKPAAKPQPKPAVKKTVPASVFSWYAQLGSYSTRALAEAGQRKLAASHASLFNGQKFVILAAQLKNGTTTYRLRVGFNSSADANSFCRNAKADGLECYVTK
jgi:hypothetical protein